MGKRVGAQIFLAMFDVINRACTVFSKFFESGSKRGESPLGLSALGSGKFQGAVRGALEDHLLAAAIGGRRGGSEARGEGVVEEIFDDGNVLGAIEDGPLIGRGAEARLFVRDTSGRREECLAGFSEELEDLIAVAFVHEIEPF